jgi:hypothetical protein
MAYIIKKRNSRKGKMIASWLLMRVDPIPKIAEIKTAVVKIMTDLLLSFIPLYGV